MEAQAPYGAPKQGPRNVALALAAWLRTQGWVVTEYGQGNWLAGLRAEWLASRQQRFQFEYAWLGRPIEAHTATCCLQVRYAGQPFAQDLFAAQQINRLKDARRLLLGCVAYANARLLCELDTAIPTPTLFT